MSENHEGEIAVTNDFGGLSWVKQEPEETSLEASSSVKYDDATPLSVQENELNIDEINEEQITNVALEDTCSPIPKHIVMPKHLAIPTMKQYMSSLSFDVNKESAYILKLKENVKITFDKTSNSFLLNGMSSEDLKDNMDAIRDMDTSDIDIGLFIMIFSILANLFTDNFNRLLIDPASMYEYKNPYYMVSVNLKELMETIGKNTHITNARKEMFLDKIIAFGKIIGVIPLPTKDRHGNQHMEISFHIKQLLTFLCQKSVFSLPTYKLSFFHSKRKFGKITTYVFNVFT